MSERKPFLEVNGLTAGYGEKDALTEVSFTLEKGEALCLVGESGCGKSTLLRAILGTDPDLDIRSGSILLEGTDLLALPPKERLRLTTRRFGMVFQSPGSAFNPIRRYGRQFIETLKSQGKYDKVTFFSQAEEALGRLGLGEAKRVLASCPYELSGGMNQRVALALALLMRQDLLLADEPTSALDATIQRQVAEELRDLRGEGGITQIVVTHNLALAKFLGSRVGVLYGGRLVELGEAEELLLAPKHSYTRALLAAVPRLDGRMPDGEVTA
jgi:ABC-type glutathione transport system ATPase component